tara:strand:- start:370 stop:726 length:357 start_codon:yes stop_codon:yes gene_type:complete
MGETTERTGEIYHLIGFTGTIITDVSSRSDFDSGKIEFRDERGNYRQNDWYGHFNAAIFSKNPKTKIQKGIHRSYDAADAVSEIPIEEWLKMQKPTTLEKAITKIETDTFFAPTTKSV